MPTDRWNPEVPHPRSLRARQMAALEDAPFEDDGEGDDVIDEARECLGLPLSPAPGFDGTETA